MGVNEILNVIYYSDHLIGQVANVPLYLLFAM